MKRKPIITQYCVNERTNEIIPYTVKDDFSTEFPKGAFLTWQDNFVAGFTSLEAARAWTKRPRTPIPTYGELSKFLIDITLSSV